MAIINTNVKSLFSQLALKNTEGSLATAMQQLSTGKRINSARDDAAGIAIATRMTSQIRSLNMAVRNAGDAISLIQTAEGATQEITDMLQRMRELAVQAVNGTNADPQRADLDLEFQQLKQEIVRIADTTEWNGFPVLNGSAGQQVGEMPVYKVTSENQLGQVLISPTTVRNLGGDNAGEVQTITIPDAGITETNTVTFPALATGDTFTVAGMTLTATAAMTATDVATAFKSMAEGTTYAGAIVKDAATNTNNVGTLTGTLTGFSGAAAVSGASNNQLEFTSSQASQNVNAMTVSTSIATAIQVVHSQGTTTTPESSEVTFGALANGQSVTVGGLTLTASGAITAANVALAFQNLKSGATTGNAVANGTFSGTLGAFDTGAAAAGKLTYTSTELTGNETDLAVSTAFAAPATAAPKIVTVGNTAGVSAFQVGTIQVGGQSITFSNSSDVVSAATVAQRIQSELTNGNLFGPGTGRQVTVSGNVITIAYAAADGDVDNTAIDLTGIGVSAPKPYVKTTQEAILDTTERFLANGSFTRSGAMAIDIPATTADGGTFNATFTDELGNEYPMTGVLNTTAKTENSTVTFRAMNAGETLTVAGLTMTATANLTAAEVAAKFGGVRETADVTFAAAGGAATPVTFGGLTFTANAGTSAANIAAAFADLKAGDKAADLNTDRALAYGTYSGTFTGFDTGAASGAVVNFKASAPGNVSDLLTSGGATVGTITQGVDGLSEGAVAGTNSTNVTWSGRLLGYASAVDAATNQVVFTSTTSSINVADIEVSSSGNAPVVTTVHGAPASSISFIKDTAANSRVITDDLTYTFKGPDGAEPAMLARALSLQVSVKGAIPAMQAGDLIINGVVIGASSAADDPFSPVNNAAGSAIAKAAAINRSAAPTGQPAGEVQTLVFSGTPNQGNITVSGVSVSLSASDTSPQQVAAKVAAALKNSATFGPGSGRSVTYTPGNASLSITYGTKEGNAPPATVFAGSTGMSIMVQTTSEYKSVNPGTGVFAKVNQNVMSGVAMTNNARLSGTIYINGYATPQITTTLNNYRQSREEVVRAINMITEKTGVKAVDTGSDQQGVQLVAADGRNIEIKFDTVGNPGDFGAAIGLREGVQAGTYSLESKVDAPIVITSSSTGMASRAGLAMGDYSKNQAVVNTSARAVVKPSAAQVESVLYANTVTVGDSYSVTINGKLFQTTAAAGATPQTVRDALISAVNADATVGVKASGGSSNGELILTANSPGTGFTLTTAKSATATATVTVNELVANQPALVKPLSANDLVLNGVSIRASAGADDKTSALNLNTSSDPSASAIAIAAAINASTAESGVRAIANGAVVSGTLVDTSLPVLTRPTMQSLFINGVEVKVEFVQDEPAADRKAKVIQAVNTLTGMHGVSAEDNGSGVSLTSDGRNLSVWFDSSVKDLSAANFGLSSGDEVAQMSRIQVGGTAFTTADTASVVINGVTVTSAASGTATGTALAVALETAINAKLDSGELTNLLVNRKGSVLEVRSTVAGSGFTLTGASTSTGTTSVNLTTVTPNSTGSSNVTAVLNGNAKTTTADTVYGTVQMIANAPKLPNLPQPIGAPPSTTESLMAANPQPFTVKVGDDGFGANGNFAALGFHEGIFGGRSSEAMNPPRVGRLAFQVGSSANQLITIDLADFGKDGTITGDITGDVGLDVANRTVRINTVEGASSVLSMLDVTMDRVNSTRATMGAVMNRLDHVINNLSNVSMNLSASRSQIQDADYAAASTDLAKSQIMQQAATAVLAQANTSQQSVLKLLQG